MTKGLGPADLPDVFAEQGMRGIQRVLRRGRAKKRTRLEPHPLGELRPVVDDRTEVSEP